MSAKEEEEKLKKTLIEDAIQKGEMKKQMEIAKNLFKQKVPLDIISNATGLSISEIEALK